MSIFDWTFDPEGSQGPASPASSWGPYSVDSSDEWVDFGIFEKNTISGEIRLKNKLGAMGGLANDILGHYSSEEKDEEGNLLTGSFVPTIDITDDEDDVMTQKELTNMNRSMDAGPLGWVGLGGSTVKRMGLDYLMGPAVGLSAMHQDIVASGLDALGFDEAAQAGYEMRDETRDLRQLITDQSNELAPPSKTGNALKDIFVEGGEFFKDPSADNLKDVVGRFTSFNVHTGVPLVLAQLGNFVVPGIGAPAIAALYGGMQLESDYDKVRYDDNGNIKQGVVTSVSTAAPSAALSGWLETIGFKGVWADTGGRWLKGVMNAAWAEAKTGAGQELESRIFTDLPDFATDYVFSDKDVSSLQISKYLKDTSAAVGWSAFGEALGGASVRAAGSTIAGYDARNRGESRRMSSLSELNKEGVFMNMAQLKVYLDGSGASPLNWKPAHTAAIEAVNNKWGHIAEVSEALKHVMTTKNDPIAAGREQALLDRTSGDRTLSGADGATPDVDAWNKLRQSTHGPTKAVAINQFLQTRDLISPVEATSIAATARQINFTTMSPSDVELYVSSLNKAKEASPHEAQKVQLQEAIDMTFKMVDGIRQTPEFKLASDGFVKTWESLNGKATEGMPFIPTALGLIQNAMDQANSASGRFVDDRAQQAIIHIQERLKKTVLEEQDPAKAAELAGPVYSAIKELNHYLHPSDVIISDEQHVDSVQALKSLSDEVAANKQFIQDQENQIVSALMSLDKDPKQAETFGRAEEALPNMSRQILTGQKPHWMNAQLYYRLRMVGQMDIGATPPVNGLIQSVKEASVSAQEGTTKKLVEKYRNGAREWAAKGNTPDPIVASMIQEDEDVIAERKEAVTAQERALRDARTKVGKAFRQNHLANKAQEVTQDGKAQVMVRNATNLNQFIEQLTDELSSGHSEPSKGTDHVAVEEAMTTLTELIDTAYDGNSPEIDAYGGRSFNKDGFRNDLNRLFLRLGILKGWDVDPNDKPHQQSMFKKWASLPSTRVRLKGIPIDKAHWAESAPIIAQDWADAKAGFENGTRPWNEEEASTMWKLVDNTQAGEVISFLKESDSILKFKTPIGKTRDHARDMFNVERKDKEGNVIPSALQGYYLINSMGARLAARNPRGVMMSITDLDKPKSDHVRFMAGAADSLRTANLLKRLATRASVAKGASRVEKDSWRKYQDVIRSLLGTNNSTAGEVKKARGRAFKLKDDLRSLENDMKRQDADSLGTPSIELVGVGERQQRESSGEDDIVRELNDADEEMMDLKLQEIEGQLIMRNKGTDEWNYGLRSAEEGVEEEAEEILASRGDEVSIGKRRVSQDTRTVRDVETNEKWNKGKGGELRTELAMAWNRANQLREKELKEFFEVMVESGYTFKDQKRLAQILSDASYDQWGRDIRTTEKKKALKYLLSVNNSVKAAVSQSSTPAGFALSLKAANYTDYEITLSLALIDAMARKFSRMTGRSKLELWQAAAVSVAGKPVRNAESHGLEGENLKYSGLVGSAFTNMKKGVIKFYARLNNPSGKANVYVAAHEVLHSLISSGYLREMLSENEIKVLEDWLGAKLPGIRGHDTHGTKLDMPLQERLISAAEVSIAVSKLAGPTGERDYLHEAFDAVRAHFFNLISHLIGDRLGWTYSGVNMFTIDKETPDNVRQALLSIFDIQKQIPAAYAVSKNGIVLTAAHKFVGMVDALMGVNIAPYLQGKFEHLDATIREESVLRHVLRIAVAKRWTADRFLEMAPTFAEFKKVLGTTRWLSDEMDAHLEVVYNALQEDHTQLDEWNKPIFQHVKAGPVDAQFEKDKQKIWGRTLSARSLGDLQDQEVSDDEFLESIGAKKASEPSDVEGDPGIQDEDLGPEEDSGKGEHGPGEVKRAMSAQAKMAETILHQVTPLAMTDIREITEPLAKFLGTWSPPWITGNPNSTAKNGENIQVRSLTMFMDDLGNLFSSGTHSLEKLLLHQGLSREYMMLMTMGGLYAQARGQMENKVVVLEGNGQVGRERWRIVNESLKDILHEIPDALVTDVWSYIRARRETELAENNLKDEKKYQQRLLAHAADPENVPYPHKPDPIDINPDTLAAATVLATVLEAKYGKDGGIVGQYASRIVKFENAAIAYKLHHYGMISEQEYRDLLGKGQWWMPSARMQRLEKELEHVDSFFNDGTREAMKNLKVDLSGVEHPFQEINRRVIAIHLLTQKVFVRSSLIHSLIHHSESGERISDRELKEKMSIEPLYTTVNHRVTQEEWMAAADSSWNYKKLPPKLSQEERDRLKDEWEAAPKKGPTKVDKDTGQVIYSVKVRVPLDRRGYEAWQKENPAKAKQVYAKWRNGVAEYFLIHDSHLRKALDSLTLEELPLTLKWAQRFTGFIAAAITHNPKFIAGMPFKDIGNALARSRGGMNLATLPWDFTVGMFKSLPYLFPTLAKRFPKTFWAYNDRINSLANQTSFADSFSERGTLIDRKKYKGTNPIRGVVDDIAAMFREPNDYKTMRNVSQYAHGLKRIWGPIKRGYVGSRETLRRLAAMTDSAFRIQERHLLKTGNLGDLDRIRNIRLRNRNDADHPLNNKEANSPGYMSDLFVDMMDRQLTLDFARKGSAVRKWATLKMFAGPMFQDTITTNQRLWDPVGRKAYILKGVATMTAPALFQWALWHNDDDWQRLSYWDKFNYFQYGKDVNGKFLQFPAPIGLAAIYFMSVPLTLAQLISEEDPMAGDELAKHILEQTPLQYQPLGQNPKEWISHVAPTIVEGSFETAMNYNPLSDSPIDYDVGKQNAELPEDRGIEKYGVVEALLAKALDTSPRLTGYWLKQQFPGVAQPFFRAGDAALTAGYQALGGDERIGTDTPDSLEYLYKWNSGNIYGASSMPVNRFYELYRLSSNAAESIDQAYDNDAVDRAMALEKAHPEAEYSDYFKSVYGQIQQLKIQRGLFLKYLSPDERKDYEAEVKANYDVPMTLLAEEAIREYNHLKETTYNK